MNWLNLLWRRLAAAPSAAARAQVQARDKSVPCAPPESPFADEAMSNFTPRAQQVLALARLEADRFNHNFIGTEHLLLGLIKLGQGTAVNVLRGMGVDLETARKEVEKMVGTGPDQKLVKNIPYTPRVKKVLALASKEAKALSHTYVGTEHILLGLLREGDGVAASVLKNLGVDVEKTRQEILKELDPYFVPAADAPAAAPATTKSPSSKSQVLAYHPASPSPGETVDTGKRYDIYCADWSHAVTVYRNARFKGIKYLYPKSPYDALSAFVEIEQSDGQTILVSRTSIIRFCAPGVKPRPEADSGKTA
jgi:hypothetical protein